MSETALVTETLHGSVACWTLQRPQQLNALNAALIQELGQKVEEVQNRNDIRCVILTGSGEKAFVAGADIKEFAASQTPAIDYVLIDDTIPELEPSTADAMQKQISARRMIYATESFDITDIILARMNGKAG